MQPFFTVACIGCKNTRLIIIIEDGFIKAGDNLDEDVLIDVNDNHNNKYNMSAIVRMISKLLKNTYKIIVLGSVVLLQLKWRYLTLRKFSPYYESQMKNVTKYKSFSFVTDMRNSPFSPLQTIFNWEPALWTLMSAAWVYLFISIRYGPKTTKILFSAWSCFSGVSTEKLSVLVAPSVPRLSMVSHQHYFSPIVSNVSWKLGPLHIFLWR